MATEVLGHVVDALDHQGLSVPDRRFVSHSDAAWDCCEQLTVNAVMVRPKLLGRGDPSVRGRFVVAPTLQFSVTLVRTSAIADAQGYPNVPADTLNAEALAMLDDLWAIWSWLTRLWGTNKLFSQEAAAITPGATPVTFDSAVPLGPQGGRAGVRIQFTVDLPVIGEALSAS
jgi:hypothetical protein